MVEDEPGQVPKLAEDARLDSLERRLEQAQATEAKRTGRAPAADANEQLGNRVLSTLIGGLVGGALVGWVLDRLLHTGHVLLIVFLVLGTVGGFWSIFKLASQKPPADGDLKKELTVAAESGKIDPMHQFLIEPLFGHGWEVAGRSIAFTNSALWMALTFLAVWAFMLGGLKRELVPGRWQAAVEGFTGFITSMMDANIGPKGRKFTPWVFSLFMFILFANMLGMMPVALVGAHPFAVTSQLTVTGVLAIASFAIVLAVGFAKHGLHFFSLFVPSGVKGPMAAAIFPIELISFMMRPFSLGLRLFVAITAGHILMEVLAGFVINGINTENALGPVVSVLSFVLMIGITLLEILVSAIQAYVFALLTSLYLNDAVNLH